MPVLAMHRDQELWLHQLMQGFQIRAVGVAGNVVFAAVIFHDIYAHLAVFVDDPAYRNLVSGDGF